MSPDIDAAEARPDADPVDEAPPRDRWRRRLPLLLALLPVLWMAWIVRGGTRMQYTDYWQMIDGTFRPDGWINVGGLFDFQNEHPVVIAKVLFWINSVFAGGSNITLGYVVIALVFAQVVIISRFVDAEDRPSLVGLVVVVAASVLLFSREGTHNFFLAMSGSAWLTANLFALAAILARIRGVPWLAVGLAVLASMSYGTGLAVWPALLLVGMVVDRRWRPEVKVILSAFVVAVAYFALREPTLASTDPTLVDVLKTTLATAGSVLSTSVGVSQWLGLLVLGGGAVLAVLAVRRHGPAAAPWIGVYVYATLSALLIGRSRAVFLDRQGTPGRYTSISSLVWVAAIGLVVLVASRRRWWALAPVAVVAVVALVTGGPEVRRLQDNLPAQEEYAAAMRLDLAEGLGYVPLIDLPRVAPLLDAIDHYPFDGNWDGDCGLTGTRLPATPRLDPDDGRVDLGLVTADGRGVRLFGWVPEGDMDDIDCVVVTDWTRRVVGAGAVGGGRFVLRDVDPDRVFGAVAPGGEPPYDVWLVYDDGTLRHLDGRLTAEGLLTGQTTTGGD